MENLMNRNITIFGDSIPKGLTTKNGKPVKMTQSAVEIIEKYYDIKIDNKSMFGLTLSKIYERHLVDEYLKNLKKDSQNYVIISIGGNDSDYNWKCVELSPLQNHSPKTPIKQFSNELNFIIQLLQKNNVKVILTTLPPIDSSRYFNEVICKQANKDKIMQFFNNDITNINRHQECYNLAIIKCAKKNNCSILDIRSDFLLNRNYLSEMSEDGIHPNEKGQERIAKLVIKMINNKEI